MNSRYLSMPIQSVRVNFSHPTRPLETWRHSVGQGGVNALPLSPKVAQGITKLNPRLIRLFLQEFFFIYPDHHTFDWSRLDPFLESFVQTGAKIVADLTIKPRVLFPKVDATIWKPENVDEWQQVIYQLVKRYSVERDWITHWEIGNETEIGELGGCPYLITNLQEYAQFYAMLAKPIREASPSVKIGGPAMCVIERNPLHELVRCCQETGLPLDFISFHYYSDDDRAVLRWLDFIEECLRGWNRPRPEIMLTEWNKYFYTLPDVPNQRYPGRMGRDVSVVEMYREPKRAAIVAASLMTMLQSHLDWSFFYNIVDQVLYPDTWRPWFSEKGVRILTERCNDLPLRMNLFGYQDEVDPAYFVYLMLSRMGGEMLEASASHPDIRVLAAKDGSTLSVMVVNTNQAESQDCIVEITFEQLPQQNRKLTVCRIDEACRWDEQTLELIPIEQREVYTLENFCTQVYLPKDSVLFLRLEEQSLPGAAHPPKGYPGG